MIEEIEAAFTTAVEKATESTVSVATTMGPQGPAFGPYGRRGHGSGVVLDSLGHILTNQHVVGGASKVVISSGDGRIFPGAVLGTDEDTDIAVVWVEGAGLRPATFGDSDGLKVGQPVLAIGNPLGLSGGPTVTSGVVSSLRRSVNAPNGDRLRVVQTDAAVNPGSSGGPLVDLQGRVIAITTATVPYAEGIGFAIPVNVALETARQIIEHGRVPHPWLGIAGCTVDGRVAQFYGLPPIRGVFVVESTAGGPAEAAGIRVGDVITAIGDRSLASLGDLLDSLGERKAGQSVEIERERHGARARVSVTLGTRPF